MFDIRRLTDERVLLFDGGMGTMLQKRGLKQGELPELLNLERPEIVTAVHREYVLAGADVITTNTFQANELKLGNEQLIEPVIKAGVDCARKAGAKIVAHGMGPLGQLMEPMGTIGFERAYDIYKKQVTASEAAGADLIIVETVSDPYEAKAAILAAKENTKLPVICTMTFQQDGRTFVGCDALSALLLLQGLGADALGVNCSLGPKLLEPVVLTMLKYSRVPVVMQANAGMPVMQGEQSVYELTPEIYAAQVMDMVKKGVRVIGGCCGTTPEHIRLLKEQSREITPAPIVPARITACSSATKTIVLDGAVTEIGERLNPTGKERLRNALRNGDMRLIISEAIAQAQAGAQVLDVNAGLPDIDEPSVLSNVIRAVQGVTGAPLMIDSASPAAVYAGARIYNGIPIINSVNGKKESIEAILPMAKKYGALIVGLTLDENGIPETAEGRMEIARKIQDAARSYGIPDENLLIDCLVLTASAQQEQVKETLKAVRLVKSELSLKTVLGISNVSFGLPEREAINSVFLASALGAGLDAAIINPMSERSREVLGIFRVLNGEDKSAASYIAKTSNIVSKKAEHASGAQDMPLSVIIEQGHRELAAEKVKELMEAVPPLEIIDKEFIPALDRTGKRFEAGEIFLPQLMLTAQAVQSGFEVIRGSMLKSGGLQTKGKVLIATVQGDIHDIGKNIVKMLLENYGYEVYDLGKDVPPETVINTIRKQNIRIAGLSALMTTTVNSMKDTVSLARKEGLDCKFIVGGAVLSKEYAEYVGADYYAADAMEAVTILNRFFSN